MFSKYPTPFFVFIFLAVAAIVFHGSQYLPEHKSFFIVVFFARLSVAFIVGMCILIGAYILNRIFSQSMRRASMLNIFGLAAAIVSILMVVASRDNSISVNLLNMYLPTGP
jgi:hypothetical protein